MTLSWCPELSGIIKLSGTETFDLVLDCMGLSAICMIGHLPGNNLGCSGLSCVGTQEF